jgi:hypothetical protein
VDGGDTGVKFKDLKTGDAFAFVSPDSLDGAIRGEDSCFFKQEGSQYVLCEAPHERGEVDVTCGGMELEVLPGARAPFVKWHADSFELFIFHTHQSRDGKWRMAYVLFDEGKVIFKGDDFFSPNDLDEKWNVAQLLGFLSLKDGDTGDEYFEKYTPEQIAWRDERAADEDDSPTGTFKLPADAVA